MQINIHMEKNLKRITFYDILKECKFIFKNVTIESIVMEKQ